jgi:hypothetical protein
MAARNLKPKHYTLGAKHYELTDWLGNVRVVINDKKTPMGSNANDITYSAQTLATREFYAFGNLSAHWRILITKSLLHLYEESIKEM